MMVGCGRAGSRVRRWPGEARIWSEDLFQVPHVEFLLLPGHVGVVGAGRGHALVGEPLRWRPRADEAPAVELVLEIEDLVQPGPS
jgi:hypothetical protein